MKRSGQDCNCSLESILFFILQIFYVENSQLENSQLLVENQTYLEFDKLYVNLSPFEETIVWIILPDFPALRSISLLQIMAIATHKT